MNDARQLLERQAAWQKTRARLSWSEKIRQAEVLRDTLLNLRRMRPSRLKTGGTTPLAWRARLFTPLKAGSRPTEWKDENLAGPHSLCGRWDSWMT